MGLEYNLRFLLKKSGILLLTLTQFNFAIASKSNWLPLSHRCDFALALKNWPLVSGLSEEKLNDKIFREILREALNTLSKHSGRDNADPELQIKLMRALDKSNAEMATRSDVDELVNDLKVGRDSHLLGNSHVFSTHQSKDILKLSSESRLRVLQMRYSEFQKEDQSAVAVEDVGTQQETQTQSGESSSSNGNRVSVFGYKMELDDNSPLLGTLNKDLINDRFYTKDAPMGAGRLLVIGHGLATLFNSFAVLINSPSNMTSSELFHNNAMGGLSLFGGMMSISLLDKVSPWKVDRKFGKFLNYTAAQEAIKRENSLHTSSAHYGSTFKTSFTGVYFSLDLVYVSKPNEKSKLFAFLQETTQKPNFPKSKKKKEEDKLNERELEWLPGGALSPGRL
ncbi:MAG: hypothetical protein KA116_09625 [Proteobacteria bacterium]|nr:hypothetical protein [Pseudomonadota bacterium]